MAGRDVASGVAWLAVGPVPTGAWNLLAASVIMMSFGSRQRDDVPTSIDAFLCFETNSALSLQTWAEQQTHMSLCLMTCRRTKSDGPLRPAATSKRVS